jgi:two-component system NtrC family sensor kinase
MDERITLKGPAYEEGLTAFRKTHYGKLFRRFVLLTIVSSVLPLLMVGWWVYLHYTRFAHTRMIDSFQTQLEHHRRIIELFLEERSAQLQLIAHTHTKADLLSGTTLNDVFDLINREYWTIKDLGVIDARGNHLAYIGPYDLLDKNYSQTFWFNAVMQKGLYISDMFMGFRKVPHFIIAVTRSEANEKWILRTTIDTDAFRSLVENVKIGKTGEVYLLNRDGIFQTSPRSSGKIMSKAGFSVGPVHDGIRTRIIAAHRDGPKKIPAQIVCQTWLKEPQWQLVVRQDYDEAFEAVNHANRATLLFVLLSAMIILIVTLLITRHMIAIIRRRDLESDQLNRQLIQASKLASIGELSAGVAHEINNPLAIILTEKQILQDLSGQSGVRLPDLQDQLRDSTQQIDIQVQRCKRITQNLLRFSRRTRSLIEPVDINQFLREVIELMEREARSGGIRFFADLQDDLPTILSDPSQLQQVFLNLITNAIDAHVEKWTGTISIRTRSNDTAGVEVAITDTGAGISPEHMSKIFDPFFTTKPVGKGTGLGLSICYSIVKRLGGEIAVRSEKGKGSEFTLLLPHRPPRQLVDQMAGAKEPLLEREVTA